MRNKLTVFGCGILFGMGLAISGMTSPAKVIGFLNLAGQWDITLLFVMASALITTTIGYRQIFKRSKPLWKDTFQLPTRKDIDKPLLFGAAIFGSGWGLYGYCPGPAIASLAYGHWESYLFVGAMLTGILSHDRLRKTPP